MKVYVAGKITGLDRLEVLDKFDHAKRVLEQAGHTVLVPTILPVTDGLSHSDYLHMCEGMIDVCNAVYFLSDWRESKGAVHELDYAQQKDMKCFFQEDIGDDAYLVR